MFKITDVNDSKIKDVAKLLEDGRTVAIATETVYGLGANALDLQAVKNVFTAKGRPQDNPLIVHVADVCQIEKYVQCFSEDAKKLFKAFSPGPLTVIMQSNGVIDKSVCGGLESIAIRIPNHAVTREILRQCALPVAAPSANLSTKPSPTCAQHVYDDLNGKIDAIVDSGQCTVGVESTVISLVSKIPTVLRPGAITIDEIKKVLPNAKLHKSLVEDLNAVCDDDAARSPGMKYKHYSPDANVIALQGTSRQFANYVSARLDNKTYAICYKEDEELIDNKHNLLIYGSEDDENSLIHGVFSALRQVDKLGAKTAYIHCPEPSGKLLCVFNRVAKSAGFNIIEL